MKNYVVTNIRLPEEDYLRLKNEAAQKRKSLAAVIREKISIKAPSDYAEKLLSLKTDWFDEGEYKKNRDEVEEQLKESSL